MIKPETADSRVVPACGDCGAEDRLWTHYIRHRGAFRRLCTSCLLRLHRQSFCPTCFQVYPPAPSDDDAVTCMKCYSSSHSRCVAAAPSGSYICPICVSPNTPIFKLKTAKEANLKTGEGLSDECRVIDGDSAKKLLAAAKIAASSMNVAAAAAKQEADRRAHEAAVARKRAKEALEQVACLVMKEKIRKKEASMKGSVVSVGRPGLGNVGYASSTGFNMARVKNENNANVGGNRNGIGPSEKIGAVGNVDRVDNSNRVLAALNAVELTENGKMGGITGQGNNQGIKDEDDEGGNVEEFIAERNDGSDDHDEIFAEMETVTENLDMKGTKQEDDDGRNKVVSVSVQTDADQMDCTENSNNEEQHAL